MIGSKLGPYEILSSIGSGGMAEVWKARDTRLGRTVAIKKVKDLATVREIMRHKSIEMTLRYSHLSPEHKQSAVETLESALTPKDGETAKSA